MNGQLVTVVFDIGETIRDDSHEFGTWADWMGVPRHTFSAVMGAVRAQDRNPRETFEYFKPNFDFEHERERREIAGLGERFAEQDLYPDVRPALSELRRRGFWVCVAGNQSALAAELIRRLALPVDEVMTSGELGVRKPDKAFFEAVVDRQPGSAEQTLYVGDNPLNDVVAASRAGLRTAFLRRGPWGHLWANDPVALAAADLQIDSLVELLDLIGVPA